MTDTFAFKHLPPTGGGNARVRSAKFGDGYSQDVVDGLNADMQKWTVVVNGPESQVQAALDWIRAHFGQMFFWTPPLGEEGLWKCNDYRPVRSGEYWTLTLTFEQGFLP